MFSVIPAHFIQSGRRTCRQQDPPVCCHVRWLVHAVSDSPKLPPFRFRCSRLINVFFQQQHKAVFSEKAPLYAHNRQVFHSYRSRCFPSAADPWIWAPQQLTLALATWLKPFVHQSKPVYADFEKRVQMIETVRTPLFFHRQVFVYLSFASVIMNSPEEQRTEVGSRSFASSDNLINQLHNDWFHYYLNSN